MPATVPMPNIFINIPLYGITTVVDSANCLVLVEVAAESKRLISSLLFKLSCVMVLSRLLNSAFFCSNISS